MGKIELLFKYAYLVFGVSLPCILLYLTIILFAFGRVVNKTRGMGRRTNSVLFGGILIPTAYSCLTTKHITTNNNKTTIKNWNNFVRKKPIILERHE